MDNDRFKMHQGDITIKGDNGEDLSGDKALEYLRNKRKTMLKIDTFLQIGDKVKLHKLDEPVIVKMTDGELFKYGGSNSSTGENLIMFNQEDIEEIITR